MGREHRPDILEKQLDKRLYAVLPVLSELQQQDFITDTMVWWNSLQDISRRSTDGSGLPLPVYTGDLVRYKQERQAGHVPNRVPRSLVGIFCLRIPFGCHKMESVHQ